MARSFRRFYKRRSRVSRGRVRASYGGYRKTFRRRRRRYRRSIARAPRAARLGVIPQKLFHTFKYCTSVTISRNAVTGVGLYEFSANNLHDPDITGVGHQPADHDLLLGTSNQLYNRYLVHACSYSFTLVNENATQAEFLIGWMPHGESPSALSDDWDRMCESPNFKHIVLGTDGSGSSYRKVVGKMLIKRLEGQNRLDDTVYGASANSSPTKTPRLAIYSRLVNTATGGSDVRILGTLWYKAQLYDRNLARTVD